MNMRTIMDPRGNSAAPLVDKMLGKAYDTVKLVAQNIEQVQALSDRMEELVRLHGSVAELDAIGASITELGAIFDNLAMLAETGANIEGVVDVHANMTAVLGIQGKLVELLNVHANLDQLFAGVATILTMETRLTFLEGTKNLILASADAASAFATTANNAAAKAQAAVTDANIAVSTVAANYDTLADATSNVGAHAERAGINVNADDSNNGFYVKQSGVWVKKSNLTLPGLAPVLGAFDAGYQQLGEDKPYIWTVIGPDGKVRELASVAPDGTLVWPKMVTDLITAKEVISGGVSFYQYDTLEPGEIILVDDDGQITGSLSEGAAATVQSEVEEARGDKASLSDRLNVILDAKGYLREPVAGSDNLRRTRFKLRKLLVEGTGQVIVSPIGDSWTYGGGWTSPLTKELRRVYGNAGHGWLQVINPRNAANALGSGYGVVSSGTWVDTIHTRPTPDCGNTVSNVAGSKITYTGPSGAIHSASLFYEPSADGQARYRWNAGTWTNIALTAGTNLASIDISTGAPSTGAWTLEIEVVSGTCTLSGVELRATAPGVRVNKLGDNGAKAASWATASTLAGFGAGQALLGTDFFPIMLGTNDQVDRTPSQFHASLTTLVTNLRAALPLCEIALIQPPENFFGRTTLMSSLTEAARDVAGTLSTAFVDTQAFFGPFSPTYRSTGTWPLFLPDDIHPNNDGGLVIMDPVFRLLNSSH